MLNRPLTPVEQREWNDGITKAFKSLLKEQQRTNELLDEIRLGVNRTDGRAKELAELAERIVGEQGADVSDAAVATGHDATIGSLNKPEHEIGLPADIAGPVTVETVQENPLQTTETVEMIAAPGQADAKPKTGKESDKPSAKK